MTINLETILGLELVGEEIDTFITILKRIHESSLKDDSIGFKSDKPNIIEFTDDEIGLVNLIYENFKPVDNPKDDTSDRANT